MCPFGSLNFGGPKLKLTGKDCKRRCKLLSATGLELLHGWLLANQGGGQGQIGILDWTHREEMEIEEDRLRLAADLMNALDRRVQAILHDRCLSTLQVFDASALPSGHLTSFRRRKSVEMRS